MAKSQEHVYQYDGESRTVREIAESIGLPKRLLNARLRKNGYDISKCLSPTKSVACDISGNVFGRLTIIERVDKPPSKDSTWSAFCECGSITEVRRANLVSGCTTSCGCYAKEVMSKVKTTHGHSRGGAITKTYSTWASMIARCYKESYNSYRNYGGKGVSVCSRWRKSFENFLEDMGERPAAQTIDRIDNNGNYEPRNCRWATAKTQNQNASQSKRWTVEGVTYGSSRDAAKSIGVSSRTIKNWCDGKTENGKFYPPKDGCYSKYYYPR